MGGNEARIDMGISWECGNWTGFSRGPDLLSFDLERNAPPDRIAGRLALATSRWG